MAEEQSFVRAAERLHVSSPAVSQRVRRLERTLRLRLFDRTTHSVRITPAGHTLLAWAVEVCNSWERTQQDLMRHREPAANARRTVRIGLSRLHHHHATVLDRLTESWPQVAWSSRIVSDPASGLQELREGDVDLLGWVDWPRQPPTETNGFASAEVVREPLWVYLPADHRLADLAIVNLADLAQEPWIAPPDPSAQALLTAVCESVGGFAPHIAHITGDTETITELVRRGAGIDLGSPCAQHAEGVARRPFHAAPLNRIRLAWAPDRLAPRTAENVLRALRAAYAERAAEHSPEFYRWIKAQPALFPGIAAVDGPPDATVATPPSTP